MKGPLDSLTTASDLPNMNVIKRKITASTGTQLVSDSGGQALGVAMPFVMCCNFAGEAHERADHHCPSWKFDRTCVNTVVACWSFKCFPMFDRVK